MNTLLKAEANVVGAVFIEPRLINEVIEKTDLSVFSFPHDKILTAVQKIVAGESKRFKKISTMTVWELLKDSKPAVDREYLGNITGLVTSKADFEDSLAIVADHGIRVKLNKALTDIKIGIDTNKGLEDIMADVDDLRRNTVEQIDRFTQPPTIVDHLDSLSNFIGDIVTNPEKLTGIPSGFPRLDFFTGGFRDEFIIIGGRPSMGKTALVLDICNHSIRYYNKKPGLWTYEMTVKELLFRIICFEAGLSSLKIKRGQISPGDHKRINEMIDEYKRANIYIDDGIYDLDVLVSKIETARDVHGIDYAVIDYIQLIPVPPKYKARSREEEVAIISKTLKALVKKLAIPIIAVAQLARRAARKKGSPPALDDLRESGALEQDADIVIFVHRPYYYGIKERHGKSMINVADIIIAKQRNGPTGKAEIAWDDQLGHFSNPAMRWVNVAKRD